MILADTSVWIDHLHRGDELLEEYLEADIVQMHPFVFGELACGGIRNRTEVLTRLARIPSLPQASHDDVLQVVEADRLWGLGFSWVDINLLISCMAHSTKLWTRDKALARAAQRFGVAH